VQFSLFSLATQFSPRTKWAHLLFVPFPGVNSSISTKLSCGATSPIQSAARFYFPPDGLLDRRNRVNQDMNNKSRVQTWFNLNHFSEEQMCPFALVPTRYDPLYPKKLRGRSH